MASRANDSDGGGSFTPSEQSDGEERSEHDSDYETDDGEDMEEDNRDKNMNIIWTGYFKRTPVILFNASCVLQKGLNFKTVGERYHLSFKFGTFECKIIRNILTAHGFHEVHPNSPDFNLLWTNSHLKPFTLRTMTEFQKINHFPRSYELTRKDRLYKNIQRMQQIKGFKHFDFVPQSFVLPGEYQEFCSHFLKDRGPWIVKPVASSRGRGVFLVNHPDQVPLDENLIVCHYIGNPLVIDGFKFDVRIYVAVTSYDPLVIYLYEEGLTRFATVKYERGTKHIRNQCMHLTNYSVNKKSQDYVKNDDADVEDYGNKWSMGAMLRYLRSLGKDTAGLMMRIEDVVIKSLLSVELSIATASKMFMPFRGNCFELYGFDILIDDTLKPWVLEVNLSPSLACDSPLDLKIKGNMLCDLFSLAGIVCHDPMMRSLQQQSRRNQEVAAKMGGRAKTAFTRPVSARTKARPQSASSVGKAGSGQGSGKGGSECMAGLNGEEIKIVRRIREEEQRKGGWIRIFPASDTWDTYGSFLQFNTTHNLMLHQRLYPDRYKLMGFKASAATLSSASKSRSGPLQIQGMGQNKQDSEKSMESYTQALVRARQYERKLGTRSRHRRKGSRKKGSRPRLIQGVVDDDEEGENPSEEEEGDGQGKQDNAANNKNTNPTDHTRPSQSSTSTDTATTTTSSASHTPMQVVVEVKVEPPLPAPPSPPELKYNVVDLLVKGGTLDKVQARSAFAMYLVRVQQRLIAEIGPLLQDDVDALNEQMDLVLRFLKRAAVNLQQTFRVVVPSRKLPLGDRRRILAKQLGDFVHIYNKETDQLKQQVKSEQRQSASQSRVNRNSEADSRLDEQKFEQFVCTASEGELEEVLTTYTKLNKSATIFLGSNSSSSSTGAIPHPPTKPPHNPLPAPSVQRAEMLQRQREFGAGGGNEDGDRGADDHYWYRGHSVSSTDVRDTGSVGSSRPPSASSSYINAVSIYSQKLSRPRSASTYKSPVIKLASRPSSAFGVKPTPFSTMEPTVEGSFLGMFRDTYNEQAIREALQRLAVRQQVRQYSAINSSSSLRADNAPSSRPASSSSASMRRGSLSCHDNCEVAGHTHPVMLQRSNSSTGIRQMTQEEYQAAQTRRQQSGKPALGKPPAGAGKRVQTNVNMANANATFNSFIDESAPQWQTEIASAYSQVTGVPPNNYHTASVNSRQFQLALQQARRTSSEGANATATTTAAANDPLSFSITTQQRQQHQRLLEQQSRAMMEASKAKHHAMVAQAHAAQRTTVGSSQSLGRGDGSPQMAIVEVEIPSSSHQRGISAASSSSTFVPKPPTHPAPSRAKQAAVHRLTRVSPPEENTQNLSFYNSLQYDIHTGQLRRTTENK